jgi:glycosyltransferase involved in cell wall biosynthesis
MDLAKSFQIHKEKFKAIIAISQWQKDNIIKQLNIPEDRIIVSRNAIYPGRFLNKPINKTPYRFIYSSDATRGLATLVELIPKIKARYPETTLYIFTNKGNIDYDTLKTIKTLDYIFLNDRVCQDQLAIEFLKSDIFFYPTNFKETYCISTVEAMASKCLVVTVKLAALTEIVSGKGILCEYPFRENKEDLLEKLFFVLDRPHLKQYFIEKAFEWSIEQTYEKLAQDWVKFLI